MAHPLSLVSYRLDWLRDDQGLVDDGEPPFDVDQVCRQCYTSCTHVSLGKHVAFFFIWFGWTWVLPLSAACLADY